MKKVSDLTGALLDYWVARAEGVPAEQLRIWGNISGGLRVVQCIPRVERGVTWRCSTDWAQGGPIIGRERISFATFGTGPKGLNGKAPIVAIPEESHRAMEGETHLIAAMRAFVASKFGDTVDTKEPK